MSDKYENVDTLISEKQLQARIQELGREISKEYDPNEEVVVICVLNGAFMFTADLVRHFSFYVNLKFIKASSYGNEQTSSGVVSLDANCLSDISGKKVIIIEDIVDTGFTYQKLMNEVSSHNPENVRFVSLLFKPSRLEVEVKIDHVAFEIDDQFVIGYGLDLSGTYREIPFVGVYTGEA